MFIKQNFYACARAKKTMPLWHSTYIPPSVKSPLVISFMKQVLDEKYKVAGLEKLDKLANYNFLGNKVLFADKSKKLKWRN